MNNPTILALCLTILIQLFSSTLMATPKSAPKPSPSPACQAVTIQSLKFVGNMFKDGQQAALIENTPIAEQEIFQLGESIYGGAILTTVRPSYVVVRCAGKFFTITANGLNRQLPSDRNGNSPPLEIGEDRIAAVPIKVWQNLSAELEASQVISKECGIYLARMPAQSGLRTLGLEAADCLVSVDGKRVRSTSEVVVAIKSAPKEFASVIIQRGVAKFALEIYTETALP